MNKPDLKHKHDIFLSIIIPAYNEAARIEPTLSKVATHLARKGYPSEIIVVDDGSSDSTTEVVCGYAASSGAENLKIMNGEPNRGKGYAVRRGMKAARGRYRLFMDADGSVDIKEVERFLFHAANGYDIVIGSISHPDSGDFRVEEEAGWHRRILGSMSHAFLRWIATPGIYDTQRGFKLFSARAAETVFGRQTIHGFGFDIELLVIARLHGLSVREVPVAWKNAAGSTVRGSDYLRTLKEIFKITSNRFANVYA